MDAGTGRANARARIPEGQIARKMDVGTLRANTRARHTHALRRAYTRTHTHTPPARTDARTLTRTQHKRTPHSHARSSSQSFVLISGAQLLEVYLAPHTQSTHRRHTRALTRAYTRTHARHPRARTHGRVTRTHHKRLRTHARTCVPMLCGRVLISGAHLLEMHLACTGSVILNRYGRSSS